MLQELREKTRSWVSWTLIILLSLAFGMWGISYYLQDGAAPSIAAEVNGTNLTQAEVDLFYQRVQREMALQAGRPLNTREDQQLKKQILTALIRMSVLEQATHRLGLDIAQSTLATVVANDPLFQEQGKFSNERFLIVLQNLFFTPESFVTSLKRDLLLNQLHSIFSETTFALPNEINTATQLNHQMRTMTYLIVPKARFTPTVKEDEIKTYYEQHLTAFQKPERIRIEYVQLKLTDIEQTLHPSDAQLKAFFDANRERYDHTATWQSLKTLLQQAWRRQEAEKRFADQSDLLASLAYSNPESLAVPAERLHLSLQKSDYFSQHDRTINGIAHSPLIVSAAFQTDILQQGNNSDVIDLGDGSVVVLRIAEHEPAAPAPLNTVKNDIQNTLKQLKTTAQIKAYGQQLLHRLHTGESQTSIAAKEHLTWQAATSVSRQSQQPDPALIQAAFQSMPQKNRYTGVTLSDGNYAILTLLSIQPGLPKPENIEQETQTLAKDYGELAYQLYLHALMNDATIKIT